MHRWIVPGLALALLLVAAAMAQATVYEVQIVDFAFNPPNLTAAPGDSIHWTNDGAVQHTVTSGENCTPNGDFDSGTLNPGQDWGYGLDEEDLGVHPYFCMFHCGFGMVGSFTVSEPTPTEEKSWGKIKKLYR